MHSDYYLKLNGSGCIQVTIFFIFYFIVGRTLITGSPLGRFLRVQYSIVIYGAVQQIAPMYLSCISEMLYPLTSKSSSRVLAIGIPFLASVSLTIFKCFISVQLGSTVSQSECQVIYEFRENKSFLKDLPQTKERNQYVEDKGRRNNSRTYFLLKVTNIK